MRFENAVPAGEKGHPEAGEQALGRLLSGTDAEGYLGDRVLFGLALAWLMARAGGRAPTVAEAYRLRSADRVEALLLPAGERPRAIVGLPGAWTRGLMHAVEVGHGDHLAFRTSPCWRRADAPGWIQFDPGDPLPVERAAGREALGIAQEGSPPGRRSAPWRRRWRPSPPRASGRRARPTRAPRAGCSARCPSPSSARVRPHERELSALRGAGPFPRPGGKGARLPAVREPG